MRIRKTIFTSLLIVLFACMPAFANINLEVNNQSINNDEGYLLNNGVTFVEAKLINVITGAKVTTEAEDVIITKNDKTIKLTLGQESFLVNEESRDLIIAPYLTDNQIMLPLRPVAEALGAKVAWDANSNTVNVSFLETKNGLTANDLLIKTSAISNELPTYDMEGSMDFRMNMSGIEEEGFPVDMTMNSKLYAHYEKEPLAIYTKQILSVKAPVDIPPELSTVETEAVVTADTYYLNSPEIGWIKMDFAELGLGDLMQTFNNQDPGTLLKQMQDFGLNPVFDNDKIINGQNYWVINVSIDKDKFLNEYKKVLGTLPIPDISEFDEEVTSILNDAVFDISYVNYINTDSFMTDFMEMDMNLKMVIPSPEENSNEKLDVNMNVSGKFNIKEADPNFQFPDVSSALDFNSIGI